MGDDHDGQWTRSVLTCLLMSLIGCDLLNWLGSAEATPFVPSKEMILQNAMQQMLHIHPSRIKHVQNNSDSAPPPPPQYMMQLYQKYTSSESMKSRSNTIRSIIPLRGGAEDEEMLLFNLNALSQTEEITSAELHFYKKKHSKRQQTHHNPHALLLKGMMVDPQSGRTRLRQWPVNVEKRGWQVYDVTEAVDQWMEAGRTADLLAFRFDTSDPNADDWFRLDTVIRTDPSPFLIVFSNEITNATLEDTGLFVTSDPVQGNALPDTTTSAASSAYHQRVARSIDDNELPEADIYSSPMPATSPGVLQARPRPSASRKNPSAKSVTAAPSSWKPSTLPYPKSSSRASSSDDDDGMTLRWPDDKSSSRKKGRKGKRRHRKLPETWHYNQQQHVNDARLDVPEDATRSLCQRRKLVVDFNEIGWGEWIISPKTFEAHYCAGRCPFPLTKELNPTNHATIQSIVHAIGGHPEVPAPCCVPDVLSSLTLLYFDDNRNVVLKNYPSMTAESCACR